MAVFGLETLVRNLTEIVDGRKAIVITTGVSGGKQIRVVDPRD